ncbi:hypothetical protein ACMD2_06770 [Ananas comosus]|uniref:ATG8-interacting protein 1 n=2 Tax=Ananas comosus TaxID=4615 RepID=A0A199VW08_ANACO|nr:hypothetical protein ACMD2_06770 [Ananas comosus]
MADDKKDGERASPHGAEWEVVSLTASAYAASPGPRQFDPAGESKDSECVAKEHESSPAMFMSGHFSLPQEKLETPWTETDKKVLQYELSDQNVSSGAKRVDEPDEFYGESCRNKSTDDLHGIKFWDKEQSLSVVDMEFHTESEISRLVDCTQNSTNSEPNDPYCVKQETLADSRIASELKEENEYTGSGLQCESWWKRKMTFLYNNAKEPNAFWSVFVAAALMGLAIVGQRWQREKLQLQQIKLQFKINDEKISCIVGPFSRVKGILVAGGQHGPVIPGEAVFSL